MPRHTSRIGSSTEQPDGGTRVPRYPVAAETGRRLKRIVVMSIVTDTDQAWRVHADADGATRAAREALRKSLDMVKEERVER
jgi:hypothetical protein